MLLAYVLTFLEGIISFISPCMLPMLPVYISYFAGGGEKKKTFVRILFFIFGFTVVFTALGVFAGAIGSLRGKYSAAVNVVTGVIVMLFGLSYLELIRLPIFKGLNKAGNVTTAFSAFTFGVVYSVSLSPCVGAFLGSALMLAASSDGVIKGAVMLLCYSLGLGIPFALSALILDKMSAAFNFIKRHYAVVNKVCGVLLIIIGILMCTGVMNKMFILVA